jgi:hypothetical protein
MPTFTIDAERVQKAVVSIEAASRESVTDQVIAATLDRLPDREWLTYDYGVVVAKSPEAPPPSLSMNARAREIGVSTVTLRKWRDERGVDVFDDDQVRAHIARSRNHSFKIAARFKASLAR